MKELGTWDSGNDLDECRSNTPQPMTHIVPLSISYQAPSTAMLKSAIREEFKSRNHWPTYFRQTVERRENGTIRTKLWAMTCKKCHRGIRILTQLDKQGEHQNKWVYMDTSGKPLRIASLSGDGGLAPRSIVSETIGSDMYWVPLRTLCSVPAPSVLSRKAPITTRRQHDEPVPAVDIPVPPLRKVFAFFGRITRLRRKA
jgi:hypothetical protein